MDINAELIKSIELAVKNTAEKFNLKTIPPVTLSQPPKKEFGDLSTNVAMQLCKVNKTGSPAEIAPSICKDINEQISKSAVSGYIKDIVIKPPAFINFFLSDNTFYDTLYQIQQQKGNFGRRLADCGKGKRVMVEFVSANPTGPLTVAHARQAAVGNAICNILEFFGCSVIREYYINDEGAQIDLLAASIYARYAKQADLKFKFPQDGYKGDYIKDIAKQIFDKHKKRFRTFDEKTKTFFSGYGMKSILKIIKKDLKDLGIIFDNYTPQSDLTKTKKTVHALKLLEDKGLIYNKDGAVWFKSTDFGDDKDRVLVKKDNTYTYITPDIAYHKDKYDRGFDLLIDIWGPDHHGYIGRIKAAQRALGKKDESLSILIVQLVTVYKAGKVVRMSKRAGEFVTLRKVLDEVGPDVAKFFFLMRRVSSHLDFDLALAKSQSLDNPVYYIQYAHARICGILRKAKINLSGCDPALLTQEEEKALIKRLREYQDVLSCAYETLEPYRIIDYLMELASAFHSFYTKHRVVTDDIALTQSRLLLINCTKTVISNALGLLGISQPEKM